MKDIFPWVESLSQNLTPDNLETIGNSKLRAILIDWQSEGRRFDLDPFYRL